MSDLFDAGEMTDQLPLLAEDPQDPKGLPRLLQFEDCASAINGLFQQALTATGASAFDDFLDFVRNFRSPDLQDFNVTPARKNGAPTYGRRSGGELVASGLLCSRLANGAQRSGIYYETNS